MPADLASFSVSALRALLHERGVDARGCLYREDLVALALQPPRLETLSRLDGGSLLAALSSFADVTVTARVRELKLATWRRSGGWAGMARHLVDDVHPIFRRSFDELLQSCERRGAVDVAGFRSANEMLRHHHQLEESDGFLNFSLRMRSCGARSACWSGTTRRWWRGSRRSRAGRWRTCVRLWRPSRTTSTGRSCSRCRC